jgi:hypothetical protein
MAHIVLLLSLNVYWVLYGLSEVSLLKLVVTQQLSCLCELLESFSSLLFWPYSARPSGGLLCTQLWFSSKPGEPKKISGIFYLCAFDFYKIVFLNYHTLIRGGDFIVIVPYICSAYLEQVHPSIVFPFPTLLLSLSQCLVVFIVLPSCVHYDL